MISCWFLWDFELNRSRKKDKTDPFSMLTFDTEEDAKKYLREHPDDKVNWVPQEGG